MKGERRGRREAEAAVQRRDEDLIASAEQIRQLRAQEAESRRQVVSLS